MISGGTVRNSVLSHNVRVDARSVVEESVLLDGVSVGQHARIRKAIIDQDVFVPDGFSLGYEPENDKRRFTISSGGVVLVPRGIRLD